MFGVLSSTRDLGAIGYFFEICYRLQPRIRVTGEQIRSVVLPSAEVKPQWLRLQSTEMRIVAWWKYTDV